MSIVSLSLWLPVGRVNFFNVSDDQELLHRQSGTSELKCSPRMDHHPNLQVSIMRRLLEVLPAFYGSEDISLYEQSVETRRGYASDKGYSHTSPGPRLPGICEPAQASGQ
jgi:hypothetical protein